MKKTLTLLLLLSSLVSFAQTPSGFTHFYDSVNMTVTNLSSNVQTKFFSKTNSLAITISSGSYNPYIYTKDPRPVEKYLHFVSSQASIAVSASTPLITLPADMTFTKQATLTVTKSYVDSSPMLTISGKNYTMYNGGTYYYAYILAPAQVRLTTVIGGKQGTKDFPVSQNEGYNLSNPVNVTITAPDPVVKWNQLN